MKKITPYFIIVMVVIIAVYDFWIISAQGPQESISATYIRWSYEYPSIVFLTGFTMGHLNWRMRDNRVFNKEK